MPDDPRLAPPVDRIAQIRRLLENVRVAERAGELNILNPNHHAKWDDIEWLLDRLVTVEAERDEMVQREERAHERHRAFCNDIARNLGPLADGIPRLALDAALAMDVARLRERAEHAEAALTALRTKIQQLPHYKVSDLDGMLLPMPLADGHWVRVGDLEALLADSEGSTL